MPGCAAIWRSSEASERFATSRLVSAPIGTPTSMGSAARDDATFRNRAYALSNDSVARVYSAISSFDTPCSSSSASSVSLRKIGTHDQRRLPIIERGFRGLKWRRAEGLVLPRPILEEPSAMRNDLLFPKVEPITENLFL